MITLLEMHVLSTQPTKSANHFFGDITERALLAERNRTKFGYVGGNPLQFTDPTGEFRVRARRAFRGLEGQYEWMFWFEFTGSCMVEKVPSPFKWLNRGRKAANMLPGHYAGENDVPKSELCGCRDIDPGLEDFFDDQGYRSSSSALGATQFTREKADRVLRDLKKEYERLVDEDCSAGDDCSALRNAYPWDRLLNLAQERYIPEAREIAR